MFGIMHRRGERTEIDSLVQAAVIAGKYTLQDWPRIITQRNENSWAQDYIDGTKTETAEGKKQRGSMYLDTPEDFQRKLQFANALNERYRAEYNPNLYPPNHRITKQFRLLNSPGLSFFSKERIV